MYPEQYLWRAVILKALSDATALPKSKYLIKEKAGAINFFSSQDFIDYSIFSGLDPHKIRKLLVIFLEMGVQFNLKKIETLLQDEHSEFFRFAHDIRETLKGERK